MNQDERRAIKILHEKYPEYEAMGGDFIDWTRKIGQQQGKPQEIADKFEKSEYFKKDDVTKKNKTNETWYRDERLKKCVADLCPRYTSCPYRHDIVFCVADGQSLKFKGEVDG